MATCKYVPKQEDEAAMALLSYWKDAITADPLLLHSAIEHGLRVLGYECIKPEQLTAVQNLLSGVNVFMSVPTGFGKSLVFQVLPFCAECLLRSGRSEPMMPVVVVISPLLSLIHDQVTKLVSKGVKAVCVSGDAVDFQADILDGRVTHVFGSPEAFVGTTKWRSLFLDARFVGRIVALAIDEAHCIVKWGMGEEFRVWYGQLSQLRSLLPSGVPVAALTATATKQVKDSIVKALQMAPMKSVVLSANRPNIRYSLCQVSRDVHVAFRWLLLELKSKRVELPKVIIFCRSINTCTSLYKMFLTELREESYEPCSSTPSIACRLFAMYHARVAEVDKKQILESMVNPDGNCRVLFCTTAFGMGIDVPNIRTVIHFGPPADVDDYFQESGRAGRDGIGSNAILYYYPGCLIGHVSQNMKEYCRLEDRCRRKELLNYLIGSVDTTVIGGVMHNCCDICTTKCTCLSPCPLQSSQHQTEVDEEPQPLVRVVLQGERDELRLRLMEFRDAVLQSASIQCEGKPMYVGLDIVCGLPVSMINAIVDNCEYISDSFDVEEKCLIWNHAGDIYRIIEDVLD